jgi:adenine-specific DNA-methyltransferase
MDKLDGMSLNVEQVERERLRALFPQCFVEGKFDVRKLEQLIGESDDTSEERYRFEWNGKRDSLKLAQTRSTSTLRPVPEESVGWDTTQNLYIEGDNLEVLKLLQTAYYRKIKMIYIDPPYNTGNDFVYNDDFADPISRYKELTSQMTKSNPEVAGRFHTNWLNMMYPRLRLAANLLTDDGVILVHMDENELVNLVKVLDEVFGEENNLGTIVWDKRNPKGDAKGVANQHEYILTYTKNRDEFIKNNQLVRPKKNADAILKKAQSLTRGGDMDLARKEFKEWLSKQNFSGGEKAYSYIDNNGDVYQSVSMAWPNKQQAPEEYHTPLIHPETGKPCPSPERGWRNPPATMKALLSEGMILFGKDETTQPRRKYYLKDNLNENFPSVIRYGGSDDGILKEMNIPFDTPKIVEIAKELIVAFAPGDNSIILDFFSGSGTTAHAIMQLNAGDGGNRKFIMVQLPEKTYEKSEAFKAGFKNICEIGKERIRRAGAKVKSEWEAANAKKNDGLFADGEEPQSPPDTGFKVFKLDDSNLVTWDTTPVEEGDLLELWDRFTALTETIKGNRSELDVVYEVMAKMGVPLTYPVHEVTVGTKKTYSVGDNNMLLVCLEKGITPEDVEAMCELAPYWLIAAEEAFADDTALSNAHYTVKARNIKMELL